MSPSLRETAALEARRSYLDHLFTTDEAKGHYDENNASLRERGLRLAAWLGLTYNELGGMGASKVAVYIYIYIYMYNDEGICIYTH